MSLIKMGDDIFSYVNQRQKSGTSNDKIREELLAAGNSEYSINKAFNKVSSNRMKRYGIYAIVFLFVFASFN